MLDLEIIPSYNQWNMADITTNPTNGYSVNQNTNTNPSNTNNSGGMNLPKFPSWLIPVIILGALALWVFSGYNGLVQTRADVQQSLGNVQSQYQRRSDLIPNLVNTVKGAANFEQTTLTQVIEARSKATATTIDPSNSTPEQVQAYFSAQNGVGSALSRLLVVTENYPTLTATQGFRDLQNQIEATENRINISRNDYNGVVRNYNAKVQSFPNNITAGIFGFRTVTYFQADAAAQSAPSVNFDTSSSSTKSMLQSSSANSMKY